MFLYIFNSMEYIYIYIYIYTQKDPPQAICLFGKNIDFYMIVEEGRLTILVQWRNDL